MGLFDKFKNNKKVKELENANDFKVTPNMYDYRPPKTEAHQPNVGQTGLNLGEYENEALEQETKIISEANKVTSYIGGAMNQINNSPGSVHMRHVAAEEAQDFFQDSVKESFKQKFPQYIELDALIIRYDMGIITEEQLKEANNIISIGKKYCQTFELKDMLLPYLIEKKGMNILSSGEKKILEEIFLDDENTYERLKTSLKMNYAYLKKDNMRDLLADFTYTQGVLRNFLITYGSSASKLGSSESNGRSR